MDEEYQCMGIFQGILCLGTCIRIPLELNIQRVLLDKQDQHCLVIITYKKQAKDRCGLIFKLCLFFNLAKSREKRGERKRRWRRGTE